LNLPDTQFGFRVSHSTIHQVHRLVDNLTVFPIPWNKNYILRVYFYFLEIYQVFDRVWHDGLLYKLKRFLQLAYYLIIKSYLTERHFQIYAADKPIVSINNDPLTASTDLQDHLVHMGNWFTK